MNTARTGSGPSPSTWSSASKLAIWRPKALRSAFASTSPRWSRSHTIMPAQVPRTGRPPSAWAWIAGSRPSRSIALVIVVLSPPGMTRPSKPSIAPGVRTSTGSAPSDASISAWAAKSPWLASTPIRSRLASPTSGGSALEGLTRSGLCAALLEQLALCRELRDVIAAHGLTELDRRGCDTLRVLEVRGGLDDGPCPAIRVLGLEDAGPDEVALGAELHDERRVGRRGDASGAEQRHRQPTRLGDLANDLHRGSELLGLGSELLAAESAEPLDAADDPAEVADGLDDVAGPGLTLGADHRGALADPAKSLAQVGRAAHEGGLESVLVDVVRLVGRGQHLGLVDVVHLERLQDLRLGEMSDTGLCHDRDGHRVLDLLDHPRARHARHPAVGPDVRGDPLERHHRDGAGVLGDPRLLGGGHVHD